MAANLNENDLLKVVALRNVLSKVKEIAQDKERVDDVGKNFSEIVEHFSILFGELLEEDNPSCESFLAAIATSFPNMDSTAETKKSNAISDLSLGDMHPNDYDNALNFWLYIYQIVHPGLRDSEYYGKRNDNIFGFALGFPLLQAKIVVMAQDPAEVNSSGFAFHGSPCPSLKKFLEFLLVEMQQLKDEVEENEKKLFEVGDEVLELYKTGTKDDASLQNWIDNRVLLVNARLTLGKSEKHPAEFWQHFTRFLLKYINDKSPHPVCFVFVGKVGADIGRDVVDPERHKLVAVNHPSHYLRSGGRNHVGSVFDYSTVSPFTTSALFRFKSTCTIGEGGKRDFETSEVMDWMSIIDRGNEEEIEEKRRKRKAILKGLYINKV